MSPASEHIPTAWLFTQGESSVHMEVTERRGGLRLTVRGPGLAVASHEFSDRESLLLFASQQERELAAKGFQLQALAERRSGGGDRRGVPARSERRQQ